MHRKKVSVILTTFNGIKYIQKQLNSILLQTVLPDEIIICDDNSTDGTISFLRNYLNNGTIKLFVNDTTLGIVNNFKKAANLAQKGNWLVFADQDDIWVPQKLFELVKEMQTLDGENTPALIFSDLSIIDKNDNLVSCSFLDKQKIKIKKINLQTLLYGNVVTGCTMIINRPMAEEFFLMEDGNYLHDEWLALIAYTFGKVKFLSEKLVLYRQHESNVTFSENYKAMGFLKKIKKDLNYLTKKEFFLEHEFYLAKAFLLKYRKKLNTVQVTEIEKFIRLEDKNYILQRIIRRITFSQYFGKGK